MLSLPKQRILVISSHYLPGYRAGGPIKTIANMVTQLSDTLEFYIVTSDRDLGQRVAYEGITSGVWVPVGKAKVMYLSPEQMRLTSWSKFLNQSAYDQIYLNSFFASQTRHTLLLRRLKKIPNCRVVLAPRGEFSAGALALKSFKKKVFIKISSNLGLYDNLVWHATSNTEITDIFAAVSDFVPDLVDRMILAPNLVSSAPVDLVQETKCKKQSGFLRVVFLSRLAPKKNLAFALAVLRGLDQQLIVFDIYGPIEDLNYWQECQQIIQTLPANIQVTYHGPITPDQVPKILANYHLFFLPTRGENFGHVIVEAWAAGCPVLISDQTPWRDLEQKGIGWDISLSKPERFQKVLRQVEAMDQREFSAWSLRSAKFADDLAKEQIQTHLQAYNLLFGVEREVADK